MVANLFPHCKMEMKENKEIIHPQKEREEERKGVAGRMMSVQKWLGMDVD